ncbi:MAG: XRE family transcriptional regulator [Clostridia bacterium]
MNRVRMLRLGKGWSQEELGSFIGVHKAAICKYEKDKVKLPENVILKFCNLFGVTADYILAREEVNPIFKGNPNDNIPTIPLVGMVHAGLPMFSEESIIEYIPAPTNLPPDHEYFYMQVIGDCMIGDCIPENALVLVQKQPALDSNAIGVVRIGDEVMLRHVKQAGDHLVLIASNSKYEPMVITEGDVQIIGRVIEVRIRY